MYFATQTIINCGFTYLHSAIDHHGIFRGEWVSARVIDFSAFPIPQFVNGTPKWPRRWLGEDKGQKINTQSRPLIWSMARPTPLPIRHTCCDDGRPLQRMSFLCLFCVSKDDINTPCPPADKFNWTPIINHGNIDLSCFLRVPRTHTHTHYYLLVWICGAKNTLLANVGESEEFIPGSPVLTCCEDKSTPLNTPSFGHHSCSGTRT